MKTRMLVVVMLLAVFLPCSTMAQPTPVEEKVAVLITAWGMPDGYNFDYGWSLAYISIGDKTEYEGQPCKIGHFGPFPYQSHMNIQPFALLHEVEGFEAAYDRSGFYKLVDGEYVSINPNEPSILPGDIPAGTPIIPMGEVLNRDGELEYPPDPNTGEDLVAGWFKIGDTENTFPNGFQDFNEATPARLLRWYGVMGGPTDPVEAAKMPAKILEMEETTQTLLEADFGDKIDVRFGYYGASTGNTRFMGDVAEDFGNEGFTKMLLSRETTDNNRYANVSATGGYCREALCEIGVLDDITIYQTRQVGRTPEFNTMNVINLKPFIEAYPKGSTIAILYVTRGLPWATETVDPSPFGRYHPWSKEIYHDNAYLNYLSLKQALIKAFGDDYNLVFSKNGTDSDIREDNFYSYGIDWNEPFNSTREAIQIAKAEGMDKMILVPGHWNYDNVDTILRMRERNGLPVNPRELLDNDIHHTVYCEDAAGTEVACESPDAVAEITIAPAWTHLPVEFGTAYYVRLRGGLERFGLYPGDVLLGDSVTDPITMLNGGTVEITDTGSDIYGAEIVIPGDPHPDLPETFTPETAIGIDDPTDPNDCMWEDADITVAHITNPPAMTGIIPVGPAVHFGPYRFIFNCDLTLTIPYEDSLPVGQTVGVGIYNHITEDWDLIDPESVDEINKLVVFKTQVLGLFQAVAVERDCAAEKIYGSRSEEVALLRSFRDNLLSKTPAGQQMIQLYYQWSPALVESIEGSKVFEARMKGIVDHMLPLIRRVVR